MLQMTDAGKTIIFFSLHYPFHFTDSYLDEELNLLATQFDKVIVISGNTFTKEVRPVPPNAVVYRFAPTGSFKTRLRALSLFLQPFFYKEVFNLFSLYRRALKLAAIKELFAFYVRVLDTAAKLNEVIAEQNVAQTDMLVYTYWMVESTMASILQKSKYRHLKVIARAHSQDVYFERSPVGFHPYRKFMFGRLSHLFFISENARNYFIEKHAITPADADSKISINRIGIKTDNRAYIPKEGHNVLKVVSVAYIQKLKRIDLIVDAISLLKDVKVEWVHVGHSNQSESDFESIKRYAAEKLGNLPNVSFLFTGKTPKHELFELYKKQQFDLFLNVSETEGIPVSMMEAMSYSVPVIGTNVGGVSEIVEDGVNGYLLSAYPNANETAAGILKFRNLSQEQKTHLRQNAFATWNDKYNAEKNYKELASQVWRIMKER